MKGEWSSVSIAPRDGIPVILWMAKDDVPPVLPVTVGFWTINARTGIAYWQIFGDGDNPHLCFDEHLHSWRPLLRGHDP